MKKAKKWPTPVGWGGPVREGPVRVGNAARGYVSRPMAAFAACRFALSPSLFLWPTPIKKGLTRGALARYTVIVNLVNGRDAQAYPERSRR